MKPNKTFVILSLVTAMFTGTHNAVADITADANTILNWAEQTFPLQLPPTQSTLTFNQWIYRNYPGTDYYAGINTQDKGVYYITGAAFRAGGQPIYYDMVANVLVKTTAPACDATQLPAGFTMTQNGNQVTVSTVGCIPQPADDPNFCPQAAAANGASVLNTMNKTVTTAGQSTPVTGSVSMCTQNLVATAATPTINLNLCYLVNNVQQKTVGTITTQKVGNCFTTNALWVTDLITQNVWFNNGDGSGFVQLPVPAQ